MATAVSPFPLFETHDRFQELNHSNLSAEQPTVLEFLKSFPEALQPFEGYLAVRSFLRSYGGNQATFNSYRTHVERMLLWCLIVAKKPLLEMKRQDGERFMEFCIKPPAEWIGPIVKARFKRIGGRKAKDTDTYIANPQWRPFFFTTSKRSAKIAKETLRELEPQSRKLAQDSIAQIFAVCGSFFQFCTDEGLTESINPIRAIKQKSKYKQRVSGTQKAKSLTPLQWSYVLDTAEGMASSDPDKHERTLFIISTIFSMYLRISDLAGRDNWQPLMSDFRKDSSGAWWFHVIGKGNKIAKISVKNEYIDVWMRRYRHYLGLTATPTSDDATPLLRAHHGREGLSEGHIRVLVQSVFDEALTRMKQEDRTEDEIDALRSASTHWLRHTSATFDAKVRNDKDLQADLRHESLSTTVNNYYHSIDEQRHRSNKDLSIVDRDL
ncbi:integrase [Pseudomonas putida]|nr:integrase [Pseudomonas putida]